MGYIEHDLVIVTTSQYRPGGLPDVESFRSTLPEAYRPLLIGPIPAPLNGFITFAFLPDGSKSGWRAETEARNYRAEFVALFNQRYDDGSSCDDVVHLTYGEDHRAEHETPDARYAH